MINPLIAVRDIHFGSSVIVAGIVFFDLFIASPALRKADLRLGATVAIFRSRTAAALWISLALSIISGFAWLCLLAARIVDKPVGDVIADGTIWIVLSQTQFGFAWELRFLFGALLIACLLIWRTKNAGASIWQEALAALLAGAYLGSLAFAGHGEEGLGLERNIHLAADFLHLIAAGLWLGGLIPLACCSYIYAVSVRKLGSRSRVTLPAAFPISASWLSERSADQRNNQCLVLIGGMQSLIDTSYGRLLLLKITLFAAMVCLAGINRQYLLPRLFGNNGGLDSVGSRTVQWLVRSALVEIVLGLGSSSSSGCWASWRLPPICLLIFTDFVEAASFPPILVTPILIQHTSVNPWWLNSIISENARILNNRC